jgi:5-(aminomethyl)-3-furanmethanol phosphate kinase
MRVIKLGGSLLDWEHLPNRFPKLVEQLTPPLPALIVVGGGRVVEAIRDYDQIHSLDAVAVHWLCVDLMNATARLAQLVFPEWDLLSTPEALSNWLDKLPLSSSSSKRASGELIPPGPHPQPSEFPLAFISPSAFYTPEFHSESLPKSWATTSDSISALLARQVGAQQLLLVKSRDDDGTGGSFVDDAFTNALPADLEVRVVNLRSEAWLG